MIRISDDPSRFAPGSRLLHENGSVLTVESSRNHRDRFLVRFERVQDRQAAEELRGALYVDAADVRELPDGEFWVHELVGCVVALKDGRSIGMVEDIVSGPAQDLLVVGTPTGEVLVPVVPEFIVGVDTEDGLITIAPPEGLL